jgi:hypothetical chaperone protein
MEPVAAAYYYESTLDHNELILIGAGGSTSDFSLLQVGPKVRREGRTPRTPSQQRRGLAGDVRRRDRPHRLPAGAGSQARSHDKVLPAVPNWIYAKLERWHHLSFLRTRAVLNMLHSTKVQALEPEKIEALIHLIEEDLGYHLHAAVQRAKCRLSEAADAEFRFVDGGLEIRAAVGRAEFEEWIAEDVGALERCIDSLLQSSGVHRTDVDAVFLTGGSSFVPAVRRLFDVRFGADRVRSGNEFTSVARGLALRAAEAAR